jgi:hypothetical protein
MTVAEAMVREPRPSNATHCEAVRFANVCEDSAELSTAEPASTMSSASATVRNNLAIPSIRAAAIAKTFSAHHSFSLSYGVTQRCEKIRQLGRGTLSYSSRRAIERDQMTNYLRSEAAFSRSLEMHNRKRIERGNRASTSTAGMPVSPLCCCRLLQIAQLFV